MSLSNPLGITPVDLNTVYVTFGAGKPITYAETGLAVSAILGHSLKEPTYWPRFLRACRMGLISYEKWDDFYKHKLARTVVALPRSVDMIRDVQIFMGGDYHYYKYFDPYIDYEKEPQKLDRFMKGSMTDSGQKRNIGKRKLFEQQLKNHKKDPRNYRWF